MIKYQDERITVFESALYRTTSTVVRTDDLTLVVDPNWLPREVEDIQNFVQKIRGSAPLYLLFTHSDYDHIIGYKAFPDARVIVSEAFENNPEKSKSLEDVRRFDDEFYIRRNYEIEYPKGDIIVKNDAQVLQIGNTKMTFFLAPGHTPDGFFTIIEPLNVWIAGDYLSNEEFPFIGDSSLEYEKTLSKVDLIQERFDIKMLIPGHGDIAFDKNEIRKRKNENLDYILKLKVAVERGEDFDLEELWKKYHFPLSMAKIQEENLQLIKKEMGKSLEEEI